MLIYVVIHTRVGHRLLASPGAARRARRHAGMRRSPNQGQLRAPARTVSEMKPRRAGPARRYLPGSPFNAPAAEEPAETTYEPRDLVSHDKYGLGSVLDVQGQDAVVVDFGTHRRRITLPCARLIKL